MEGPPHAGHLKRRQVSTEEGQLWAKEEGLLFVEASAKSGQNVDRAFEEASRDILDKIKRGVFDDNRVRLYPFFIISYSYHVFHFGILTQLPLMDIVGLDCLHHNPPIRGLSIIITTV